MRRTAAASIGDRWYSGLTDPSGLLGSLLRAQRELGLSFWWPTWGGRNFIVYSGLLNRTSLTTRETRQRTLLEELVDAGDRLNQPERNNTISFTPLGQLTPSTIPSDLSDLSETASSPLITEEAESEDEVENLISQTTTASGTRSRTRAQQAQAQAQSAAQSAAPEPTQPDRKSVV